jgi:hypothetical protein
MSDIASPASAGNGQPPRAKRPRLTRAQRKRWDRIGRSITKWREEAKNGDPTAASLVESYEKELPWIVALYEECAP